MRSSKNPSQALKRKMVIVPFKTKPKLPDNFETTTWTMLERAIQAVNTKVSSNISKEELYRSVEDLCMHKMAEPTYEKLRVECERHISQRVQLLGSHQGSRTSFLQAIDTMWQDHCEHMIMIRNIFLYLDRSYALQAAKVLSIWDLGLKLLRDELEDRSDIEEKLIVGLLDMVEQERNDQMFDRDMMRRLLRMLYSVGLYAEKFQVPFILDTTRYFRAEGARLIQITDATNFCIHVEKRLVQANDMVMRYLDLSTRHPLLKAIESELLEPHIDAIVTRGLGPLLKQARTRQTDLRRLYNLLDRVSALPTLCTQWCSYFKEVGQDIVNDDTNDKTMVEELLGLQETANDVLSDAFTNDERFRSALKESWEFFVNSRQNKPAELLARFVDRKMRGEKGRSESETESILDRVMTIFSYLSSKDVFEAFYKKMLSKRLLLKKSASFELEKAMLSKLKAECGSDYTSKLDGMLKDIGLSEDVEKEYKRDLIESGTPPSSSVETEFKVLRQGVWPTATKFSVAVPPELSELQNRFEAFYTSKHRGHRLTWTHALDQCIMTFRLPKAKKELELSFFQALVLRLFVSPETELVLADMAATTGIEDKELRRTLQSLACGKLDTRVLTKTPKGREVDDSDTFKVNMGFTNKLFRIKINTIQMRETTEEVARTHEEVFRERLYQVDAVIVRTMKARKILDHNGLMAELHQQLRFPARNSDLKGRIESLIERDYIERDREDPTKYKYLA